MRRYMKYGGHEEQQDLLDKAGKENDPEKKKSYIEEACELYRGEFLPQLGAEGWAVVLNVYYKNLFHLSFGFNRCGKVRIFDWNRTITNVKK